MRSSLTVLCFISIIGNISCKKFLAESPNKYLTKPSSIEDLQGILDFYTFMNAASYPVATEVLADDYYLNTPSWNAVADGTMKNLYLWLPDENTNSQWSVPYSAILSTNIVLDELPRFGRTVNNYIAWDNVKGSALFFRAYYYYALAQLFCKPYNRMEAINDLGLCLRLDANQNELSRRSSVRETYDQIIRDLRASMLLLPSVPLVKSRPSAFAAYGALAKIYLSMGLYDSAGTYAGKCIEEYGKDSLLNFNENHDVNVNGTAPFKRFNKEVIFQMRSPTVPLLSNTNAKIDSGLYNSYSTNDLRKTAYFKSNGNGSCQFKGDYDGAGTSTGYVFAGIVLDEMFLIRAEAKVRAGAYQAGLDDLNKLLVTRWKVGTYEPILAADSHEALKKVLMERRKELVRRGARWIDIRRLSADPGLLSIVPERMIEGQLYKLNLNSNRYMLKIPADVITMTGIEQNP